MASLSSLPRGLACGAAACLAASVFADDIVVDFGANQTISTTGNYADVLYVGDASTGTFNLTSGGSLSAYMAILGNSAGSDGTLNLTGAGSLLTTSGNFYVGYEGTGTLNDTDGGSLQTGVSYIGLWGAGSATVSGPGSTWEPNRLTLAGGGTASLVVEDGATVSSYGVSLSWFGGTGSITLRGTAGRRGMLATESIDGGSSATSMTLDGGVLRATTDFAVFNPGATTISSGGGFIDTQGYHAEFASPLSGPGALTKLGAGTLTLSSTNTHAGGTIVDAGTLALGAHDALGSGGLTMNAGTLAVGGFDQTLGTLAVRGDATFDFAGGASSLVFADSSAIAWTGSLTLLNFTLGSDLLSFGSASGLSATQLGLINLAGYTATGLDASGNVQFTASAIPEPSTYAFTAAAAALGFALLLRRRPRAAASAA